MSFTSHSPQHEERKAKWSCWHKELRNAFPAIMARKKHLLRTVHSIKKESKLKLLTPGITQLLQSCQENISFTSHSPQHEERKAKWSCWHKEMRNAFPAIMARKKHLLRTVHSIKKGSKVKLLTPGIMQLLQSWQENISFTSHCPQHQKGRQSEVVDTKNYATLFLQSWQEKTFASHRPQHQERKQSEVVNTRNFATLFVPS